jgi:carbonic anhydrase/acetyltransferase-like protein (isoleucine patch superfamily)
VGARCSVGSDAVVLCDTEMGEGSRLGSLSLLMHGETLPAGSSWVGSPARRINHFSDAIGQGSSGATESVAEFAVRTGIAAPASVL